MMKKYLKKLSLLLVLTLVLSSCGSSYLKDYENISNEKKSYNKIIVIGRSSDELSRVKFENDLVQYFSEQGITAVASHKVAATSNIQNDYSESEINAIQKELIEQGIDGSVITSFIDSQNYQEVISGGTSTNYYPTRVGRFGRGFAYYPITTWQPDQIQTGIKYRFESSFYRLGQEADDNLQWLGRFEIKDPNNLDQISSDYAKELASKLLKESISQ